MRRSQKRSGSWVWDPGKKSSIASTNIVSIFGKVHDKPVFFTWYMPKKVQPFLENFLFRKFPRSNLKNKFNFSMFQEISSEFLNISRNQLLLAILVDLVADHFSSGRIKRTLKDYLHDLLCLNPTTSTFYLRHHYRAHTTKCQYLLGNELLWWKYLLGPRNNKAIWNFKKSTGFQSRPSQRPFSDLFKDRKELF